MGLIRGFISKREDFLGGWRFTVSFDQDSYDFSKTCRT